MYLAFYIEIILTEHSYDLNIINDIINIIYSYLLLIKNNLDQQGELYICRRIKNTIHII